MADLFIREYQKLSEDMNKLTQDVDSLVQDSYSDQVIAVNLQQSPHHYQLKRMLVS